MYFYCIDFESTGAANGQEPLEFAWVEIDSQSGKIAGHFEVGFSSVKGGRDLSDHKKTVPHLRDIWPEVQAKLQNSVIVGHNVNYDFSLLNKTFPGFNHGGLIDTLTIYRQLYGNQIISYSLEALLEVFDLKSELEKLSVNDHFQPHRALYDAFGCALLTQRLLQNKDTAALFRQNDTQQDLF